MLKINKGVCSACGGESEFVSVIDSVDTDNKFLHLCKKCGHNDFFDKQFPHIVDVKKETIVEKVEETPVEEPVVTNIVESVVITEDEPTVVEEVKEEIVKVEEDKPVKKSHTKKK